MASEARWARIVASSKGSTRKHRWSTLLATELREWQAPCSDSNDGPRPTMAPTRGFNKDNAKH